MDNRIKTVRLKTAEKARRVPEGFPVGKITQANLPDQLRRPEGKYCKVSNFHIGITLGLLHARFQHRISDKSEKLASRGVGDEGFSNLNCG